MSLLPANSTDFERKMTQVLAANTDLAVDVATLLKVDDVKTEFLSFLAWQYSVDSWNNNWQPSLQRQLIKRSFSQHQYKGTIYAIKSILQDFGYSCAITEWFNAKPQMAAGSFTLTVDLNGRELSDDIYHEINRLVLDAKPASRHLVNLTINISPVCKTYIASFLHIGEYISILPKV